MGSVKIKMPERSSKIFLPFIPKNYFAAGMRVCKRFFRQLICWILLLQLINISIDPPDLKRIKDGRHAHSEDLSINEIESVYELISERVFDTSVPESDDDDITKSNDSCELYFPSPAGTPSPAPRFAVAYTCSYQDSLLFLFREPNLPPPKHA